MGRPPSQRSESCQVGSLMCRPFVNYMQIRQQRVHLVGFVYSSIHPSIHPYSCSFQKKKKIPAAELGMILSNFPLSFPHPRCGYEYNFAQGWTHARCMTRCTHTHTHTRASWCLLNWTPPGYHSPKPCHPGHSCNLPPALPAASVGHAGEAGVIHLKCRPMSSVLRAPTASKPNT